MSPRRSARLITAGIAVATLAMVAPPGRSQPAVVHAASPPFTVGADVESYTPYCGPQGTATANHCTPPPVTFTDPAECGLPAVALAPLSGPRLFAFEEPYFDQKGTGHYDLGDPYLDCNGDGRWDGNFIGGGSNAPRFYNYVADAVGARAVVVANGTRTIAIEVLDHEGAFDGYLAATRQLVAQMLPNGASLNANDIFISSTHDESAPDSIGLYGVTPATSSTNLYWVAFMEQQAALAIVNAYKNLQPATITYAEAIQPATMRQCYSSYPFVDDQLMPSFQATNANTHQVIVTLADVSQHTETLGFNGGNDGDPGASSPTTLETEKTWLTADWPYWFRNSLEQQYPNSIGIEMAGSVGSNETPQVFPTPVSRTPQQFVDAGHPAGCRTTFTADQNTAVPLGYFSESKQLGIQLAGAVATALQNGTVSASTDIQGSRSNVCFQVTNALFDAVGIAGVFAARPGYADPNCTQAIPVPPSGNTVATFLQTQVAAFRIGDGTFVSMPGEVFPFTYLRSFLGPGDMPCPDPSSSGSCGGTPNPTVTCASGNPYALPPWLMPHMHTPYRFIDGLGEDMVGYIFPCGNGIGVPGEYPVSNPSANSGDRFGCGHSDDSESASSDAGTALGNAAVPLLDNLEGSAQAPELIAQGRYVLPDGTLSRDPLGTPGSIGCNLNTLFNATGPATAVRLADGTTITPAQWMSLSGRAQPGGPDRNTRGWIDASGQRHWLDVFPEVTPPAQTPETPWTPLLLGISLATVLAVAGRQTRRARREPG
jgi:hypothetical protein